MEQRSKTADKDDMSFTYQIEDGGELIPSEEMRPLLERHWNEVAGHKDKIPLNPDFDRYKELANMDALCCTTMRSDGELVGYFICFVVPHIHYKEHPMAFNDAIFILPEYRRGLTPVISMLKSAEKELRRRGVSKIVINTKLTNDFGPVLRRVGFVAFETVYEKMLI